MPGKAVSPGGRFPSTLPLCFASADSEQIGEGGVRLGRAVRQRDRQATGQV